MKRVLSVVCVMAVMWGAAAFCGDSGPRTWTSSAGQTVDATFVKMSAGLVHLRRADGTPIVIPLARLSGEDQIVARDMATAALMPASAGGEDSPGAASNRKLAGGLSQEEIDSLMGDWTDGKGTSIKLEVTFDTDTDRVKSGAAAYRKNGRIPVRITVGLYESKPGGSRTLSRRLPGRCTLYVADEEGKLAFKSTEDLNNMCPT